MCTGLCQDQKCGYYSNDDNNNIYSSYYNYGECADDLTCIYERSDISYCKITVPTPEPTL